METRRLTGGQLVTVVVALCAAVVLAPVGVMAATGSLVNITDPINANSKARVTSVGGVFTTAVDPVTKSAAKVDGGAARVGGTVSTKSLDTNTLLYVTPVGGANCGASSAGVLFGTLDTSRYSKLRFAVKSGPSNQSIISLAARAGSQLNPVPFWEWTVPAGQHGHNVVADLPTQSDLRVHFCGAMQMFVYGLR